MAFFRQHLRAVDPWPEAPETLGADVQKLVERAARIEAPEDLKRKYAQILIATQLVAEYFANGLQDVSDEMACWAALEHGIFELDPERAKAMYARARKAEQQVHASAEGCATRVKRLEELLSTRYHFLRSDIAARFPLAAIAAASKLIGDFAAATVPVPQSWADVQFVKPEVSLTASSHALLWWFLVMRSNRGKWIHMYQLARCWHLTDSKDISTFRRRVRKLVPKPDAAGMFYVLGCPPWALV